MPTREILGTAASLPLMSLRFDVNLPKPEVKPGVRFASVGDTCLVFDSTSGRYLTFRGAASTAWLHVAEGHWPPREFQAYVGSFSALQLLRGDMNLNMQTNDPGVLPDEIELHSQFDHLILEDPYIDLSLVGALGEINLPPSNHRKLLERFQVRTFVNALLDEAHDYSDAQSMVSFDIRLGESTVRVLVPSIDLELDIPLSSGFLPVGDEYLREPDFTITVMDNSLWERRTQPHFQWDWHFPLGIIHQQRSGEYRVAIDRHTQTVSAFSPLERQCVVWMSNYNDLPYWSAATPLRLQLSWIADSLGIEFLHAAAVDVSDRAILFAGPSGSGKSTLSLRLAQLGFPLISDDFLLATDTTVQAVYRRLKVHDWSAERVVPSNWTVLNKQAPSQKRIVDPGDQIVGEIVPIGAIVIPEVGGRFSLEPISAGEALSAIAPASLSGLLGGNLESLERIGRLVSNRPCYRLRVDEAILKNTEGLTESLAQLLKR